MGLIVAVTGPTGEIGRSAVAALERDPAVERIVGMGRRPFDPVAHGWKKTVYLRGDILDRTAVDELVADADVVIHLAYAILGSRAESAKVNLEGTRTVLEAAVAAERVRRLVYTSSVVAYGYHRDAPLPLTEDRPVDGSPEHYYSQQKAACEALLTRITSGTDLEVFVLRPCVVAGPDAPALAEEPWGRVPRAWRELTRVVPLLRPVVPDPGVRLQLVHHDDVASAIALATTTSAEPGAYNIAGDGLVSLSRIVAALGGRPVPVPEVTIRVASAALAQVPFIPSVLEWVHMMRTSIEMDTTRARRELGWRPEYSSARTLEALAASLR